MMQVQLSLAKQRVKPMLDTAVLPATHILDITDVRIFFNVGSEERSIDWIEVIERA